MTGPSLDDLARMLSGPNQSTAVHAATEAVQEFLDPPAITSGDLDQFAAAVLTADGWSADAVPEFVLDVADDDDDRAGWCDSRANVIHLHPQCLDAVTVLHELAHWVRPHIDGHGPQFVGAFVSLVRAAMGHDAADQFCDEFEAFGVEIDPYWANRPEPLS